MELAEFLEKLRETPRDWELRSNKSIRRGVAQCPISSLRGMYACSYMTAANYLGLPTDLAIQIGIAADAEQDPMEECGRLRAKLLEACGLVERGEKGGVER